MSINKYKHCIDACTECAVACNHCASECLKENEIHHLAKCIQLDLECSALCRTAAELMSLGSVYAELVCDICTDVCNACAEECEKHSEMDHCRECAEVCRMCANACLEMIEVV